MKLTKSQLLVLARIGASVCLDASFDYTVSAMAQGHAVSISSLQNCAANARAVLDKAKGQA